MKILAIRGENLASLQGAFCVDLAAPPFDRAGLFAITGPTGAGKSTLLDAICLALYGTTPRMNSVKGRGHAVGGAGEDQRILSNDERALLRKGCGEGFAEVDFLGRDGKRYRARWTVRRARGRADGRFQAASAELWDVGSEAPIGRTKTDVYAAIEERIGLSYEQFCRSVLLAQGEFARFLLAGEKERAELLERVTGTEIYREISILAHERHVEERKAGELLEQELRGVKILSAEERSALEAQLAVREQERQQAEDTLKTAAAALQWHRRLDELISEEGVAQVELQAAIAAWEEAGQQRAQLASVEKALPLRPLFSIFESAAVTAGRAVKLRGEAVSAGATALGTNELRSRELSEALQALEATKRTIETEGPLLVEARRLDTQIEGAQQQAVRANEAASKARSLLALQTKEVEDLQGRLDKAREIEEAASSWIVSRPHLVGVGSQWERWQSELSRHLEGTSAVAALSARVADAEQKAAALRIRLAQIEETAVAAQDRLAAAEAQAKAADQALASLPGKELREMRLRLESEDQAAMALESSAEVALRLVRQITARNDQLMAIDSQREELGTQAVALEARWSLLSEQASEAEEQLRQARDVLELADRRGELREGEACPLCGSLEHPFSAEEVRGDERVRERKQRLDESVRAREEARQELARALARQEEAGNRWKGLSEELEALGAERLALEGTWSAALLAFSSCFEARRKLSLAMAWLPAGAAPISLEGGADHPDGPALRGLLAAERRQQRAILVEKESESERLMIAVQEARHAVDQARTSRDGLGLEKDRAQGALQQAVMISREAESGLQSAYAQVAAARAALGAVMEPFPGWEARLAAEGVGYLESLATEVHGLRSHEESRRLAEEQWRKLEPVLEAGISLLAERREAEAAALVGANHADAELIAMRAKRHTLLEGASVAEVEKRQRLNLAGAEQAFAKASSLANAAEVALAQARAAEAAAEAAAANAEVERSAREGELVEALALAGLELEEAKARLSIPVATVASWQEAREAGVKRRERAVALAEQRLQDRQKHETGPRPSIDKEQAALAHQEAGEIRSAAETAWHDLRSAVQQDDLARVQGAEIQPRIDAQRRVARKWETIHTLIGAASGDKFQLFAQSLTLDVLLTHANIHLEQLAHRYRLERVPGHDLELQILDGDMADEIRAVNSLSGGESFLVSLALALGLSGLSARNTPVESLFIDEGFGSLDPQTLDTALATLDALQASGRKVGIISHVQGMAERIGVQIQVRPRGQGASRVEVVVH